jgi:hypothetical protein
MLPALVLSTPLVALVVSAVRHRAREQRIWREAAEQQRRDR